MLEDSRIGNDQDNNSKTIVEHIDIPFDQLGIFQNRNEERYEQILTETLLLSTLGYIHASKKQFKATILITVKALWIITGQKIRSKIPIKSVDAIIKSTHHPELVLLTGVDQDNIRITTSTSERSIYIISTFSYIFTYVLQKSLVYITVNQNHLDYFERSVKDKEKNKNINIDSYKKNFITYQKPFKNIQDIYGSLGNIKINSKIILEKQLQVMGSYEDENHHMIYLAKIKNDLDAVPSKRFICHYIQKKHQYLQPLFDHKNLSFVTKLIYAKALEFKIHLFFEYSESLRGFEITPAIFARIWEIYNLAKQEDPRCVISTDLLQVIQMDHQSESLCNHEENRLKLGHKLLKDVNRIMIRQFRYAFLNERIELDRFLYQKQESSFETNSELSIKQAMLGRKSFNIGMILYELATGRHILSFQPAITNKYNFFQQQLQFQIQLKRLLTQESKDMEKQRKIKIFPKFLDLGLDEDFQQFLLSCIFGKFTSQQQIFSHPWFTQSKNIKLSQ